MLSTHPHAAACCFIGGLMLLPLTATADTTAVLLLQPQKHNFSVRVAGYCSGEIQGSYTPANTSYLYFGLTTAPGLAVANQQLEFTAANGDTIGLTGISFGQTSVRANKGKLNFQLQGKQSSSFLDFVLTPILISNNISCKDGSNFSELYGAINSISTSNTTNYRAKLSGSLPALNYRINIKRKVILPALLSVNCSESGVLTPNLANLSIADYRFRCKSLPPVTISYSISSVGTASLP